VLGARAARTLRAVERWLESNDARGCLLELLVAKVTESASNLGRDLTVAEVHAVCESAVAAHVHAEEQRAAQEAIAGAREQERLAYLRRKQAEYRQGHLGAGIIGPRGQR
jgi:hypothetical protein